MVFPGFCKRSFLTFPTVSDKAALDGEIAALESEIETARNFLDTRRAEQDGLKSHLSDSSQQIAKIDLRMETVVSLLDTKSAALAQANAETAELSARHAQFQKQYQIGSVASRLREIQQLSREAANPQARPATRARKLARVEQLKRENAEKYGDMDENEHRMYRAKRARDRLDTEVNQLKAEHGVLTKERETQEEIKKEFEDQIGQMGDTIRDLERDCEAKQGLVSEKRREVADIMGRCFAGRELPLARSGKMNDQRMQALFPGSELIGLCLD
jgi:chromosome segregation ATPase